jgi:hypothetical protein
VIASITPCDEFVTPTGDHARKDTPEATTGGREGSHLERRHAMTQSSTHELHRAGSPRVRAARLAGVFAGLVLLGAAQGAGASPALAHQIQIDPGSYVYPYSVNGSAPVAGPVTVALPAGTHDVETGGYVNLHGVASSTFRFTVTATGEVANVENAVTGQPSGAAIGQGGRLVFNQASITIDPGRFRDAYFLQYATLPLDGEQTVVLVPDVAYLLEHAPMAMTPRGDASGFYFVLDRAGRITRVLTPTGIPSASAVGTGHRLLFNR